MDVIVKQAELAADFKVSHTRLCVCVSVCVMMSTVACKADDGESLDRFITCFKQALKFCKVSKTSQSSCATLSWYTQRGCEATSFLVYLCQSILPVYPALPDDGRQV